MLNLLLLSSGFVFMFCAVFTGAVVCYHPKSQEEDLSTNSRWVAGIAALVFTALCCGCMYAALSGNCEQVNSEEYKVLHKYRLEKQQQTLAKEIQALEK